MCALRMLRHPSSTSSSTTRATLTVSIRESVKMRSYTRIHSSIRLRSTKNSRLRRTTCERHRRSGNHSSPRSMSRVWPRRPPSATSKLKRHASQPSAQPHWSLPLCKKKKWMRSSRTLVARWTSPATAHSICLARLSKPKMISRPRWNTSEPTNCLFYF